MHCIGPVAAALRFARLCASLCILFRTTSGPQQSFLHVYIVRLCTLLVQHEQRISLQEGPHTAMYASLAGLASSTYCAVRCSPGNVLVNIVYAGEGYV